MSKRKNKKKIDNRIEKKVNHGPERRKHRIIFVFTFLVVLIIALGTYFAFTLFFKDLRGGEDWNVLLITLDTTRADRIG
ncbi:MAG: hypothetical protein ACUVUG_10365, partial [Candidatus Aminicenantia bacterium]